jgi:hypothetical protein
MNGPAVPPGWYPDPGGGGWRWWNGRAWTGFVRPARRPSEIVADEQRFNRRGRLAVVGYLLIVMVSAIVDGIDELVYRDAIRHWFNHPFKSIVPSPETCARLTHGYSCVTEVHPLQISSMPGFAVWLWPLQLVEVLCVIFFLIWQYRAATAARLLGFPARRSPGWGVGSWFVPVVNLWMPFQALRDCLPPGYPRRRAPWLLLTFMLVVDPLALGAAIGCIVAPIVGVVCLVVEVLVIGAALAVALRFVRDVRASNRQVAFGAGR